MQCGINVANDLAETLLQGMEAAISTAGLSAISRSHQSVGPIPAEDCCPDLVVWLSNIRIYDAASPDTLNENRVLIHYGLAFDINVRIGLCFLESIDNGDPMPTGDIHDQSVQINQYALAAYVGGLQSVMDYRDIVECDLNIRPNPADPYNSGGCAGFTWTITFSLI